MYPRGLTDDHETAVRAAASAFRAGLERGGLPMISLADFPKGSCGDTCELLGQFLADSGLGEWQYRSGQRDEPFHTHAWLEQDGLILDITADQFPDVDEPVLLTRGPRLVRTVPTHGGTARRKPQMVRRSRPCRRRAVDVQRVGTARCPLSNGRDPHAVVSRRPDGEPAHACLTRASFVR
jgi:hypothetical protein